MKIIWQSETHRAKVAASRLSNKKKLEEPKMDNEITEKVWGEESLIFSTPLYTGKFLYVKSGYQCSLHMHPVKDESFLCLGGSGVISVNGELKPFFEGSKQRILPGMTLLEVSTFHSDSDVQRKSESRALTVADHRIFNILGENGNANTD